MVEHADYIQVLDYETWKPIDLINEEMEELHQGWLNHYEVTDALVYLRDQGSIEHHIFPHVTPDGIINVHEFKRNTEGGNRKEPLVPPLPRNAKRPETWMLQPT